jgi:hypothetical protein
MAISLSSVSKDPILAPPRIVLYGVHGVGKTTFGACAPAPILMPFEDGIGKLEIAHFPILQTWGDTLDALGALINEQHDYSTVVIDSLDWLEPIVWAEVCKRHGKKDIEEFGYGKGYLFACDVWREFFDGLRVLRQTKSMAVVLIAHTEIKQFADPNSDPYDRYQIKLQPRASALAEEWADCVLFAGFKTYTAKADVGFNRKVTRGVGSGERVLYTEERPGFRAKNRYGLPAELPFTWAAFSDALVGAPVTEAA